MSHWNYRVIRSNLPNGETMEAVHEVYYDDDGEPTSWSSGPIDMVSFEEDGGLREMMKLLMVSVEKPVMKVDKDGSLVDV